MKEIVKWSLESAQDMIENRKNSHELFGYDFMIDEDYNPWLIEINSSPAMDYSTVKKKNNTLLNLYSSLIIYIFGYSIEL